MTKKSQDQRTNQKKSERLGMSSGTARARLLRDIIFNLLVKSGGNACYHCGKEMTRLDYSIEHIQAWLNSTDPVGLYFSLENISFSHFQCNLEELCSRRRLTPEEKALKTKNRRDYKAEWMRRKRTENKEYCRKRLG